METVRTEPQPAAARLGLWDTTSIIVGIIVGVGIYVTPARIFRDADGPWQALGLWVVGGLFSLIGAFCYAELASTYPRSGGEYVYLTRAYGSGMGFLFGWAQLAVIRPAGSIAVVAFGFAEYAGPLFGLKAPNQAVVTSLALAPILVLTFINLLGVYFGKRTQNVLTALKVLGIAGILTAGFLWAGTFTSEASPAVAVTSTVGLMGSPLGQGPLLATSALIPERAAPLAPPVAWGLALAMMYIMWTYAGWQEAAYVASEVRDRRRNLPLALILGAGVVTCLYLLINLAYLAGLGFEGARNSSAVAADVLSLALGKTGALAMSLLVVISTLGALNGMIFTSSRIFAEMGADHPLFAPLGRWNRRWGTPMWSLLVQGALCVGMVLLAGLSLTGKSGFDGLVQGTAAVFWLFFLLTGVAVLVLRFREPKAQRPFRVPFYPLTPLLFCAGCAAMLYGSVVSAPLETLAGVAILVAGLPLYLLSRHLGRRPRPETAPEDSEHGEAVVGAGHRAG